ncbi:MAG: hypothetical protein JWP35_1418 [Caulobacter sp.]|nr:hypothetical protein [Caulobacter sp.]
MTNRVHIDAPAGVIDIEGEKDFVEGLLAKLFPLIEEAGFGSRPTQRGEPEASDAASEGEDGVSDDAGKEDKARSKRKRGATPKGHSCADRMIALRDEGFFKTQRSAGEIVTGLAGKGFTHKSNQVSAAGESLFGRGLLQRTKDGSGPFKYFWDRT